MSAPTIADALDYLWGLLDVDQVLEVERDAPQVVEVCKANHEAVAHPKPQPAPRLRLDEEPLVMVEDDAQPFYPDPGPQ